MTSNETKKLNYTCRILKAVMITCIMIAVVIMVLFQTEALLPGSRYDGSEACNHEIFAVSTILEILTITAIPLTLKFFKLKFISRKLAGNPGALLRYGLLRMLLLMSLLVVNVCFYYIYAYSVAFGYMAIVLAIVTIFIIPTKERCIDEISISENNTDVEK